MQPPVKPRHRWTWVVLVAALLFVGGPMAYILRPLNTFEQAIVGQWDNGGDTWTFKGNRTFVHTRTSERDIIGSWSASANNLSYVPQEEFANMKMFHDLFSWAQESLSPRSPVMKWEGPDRFILMGVVVFTRVTAN